jgi:hypothetical protein
MLQVPSGAARISIETRPGVFARAVGLAFFHRRKLMPTIAYFYGISIKMYFNEHPPPHFSAAYSGHEANVSIETGDVIEGYLPANAARLVKRWALAHRSELEDNWRRARTRTPLAKIAGLDND